MSDENLFRDFMDFVKNSSTLSACDFRYNIHSRIFKNILDEYESHQLSRTRKIKEALVDTNNQNQITRWYQERLGLNHSNQPYTDWYLLTEFQIRVLCNTFYAQLKSEYVITKSTLKLYLEKFCSPLQCKNLQHLHQMLKKVEVSRSELLEIIKMSVQKIKFGRPNYLNSDEEALVVASAQIEGAHGLPIYVNILGSELHFFIKAVNEQKSTKDITPKSSSKYTWSVIKQVNCTEDVHDKQRKKSRTLLVKVSSISNNRLIQINPRLAWLMFHKIAQMYRDIRKKGW